MPSFHKAWARQDTAGMTDKFRDTLKPQGALKPRIQNAVNKLQAQTSKMDTMLGKLEQRDQQLFQRVVTAVQNHDKSASTVLSNELAEVRKVKKMIGGPSHFDFKHPCLRISSTRWLDYDIWFPSHNLAFEYQGKQHYEPIDFFGGSKAFARRAENDKIKTKLSKENGVILIQVPYWLDLTENSIKKLILQNGIEL